MKTNGDAKIQVGNISFLLTDILNTIEKIAKDFPIEVSEDAAKKIKLMAFYVMVEGIKQGIDAEGKRLASLISQSEVEFKKLQDLSNLMQKINLTITPAKGEA
jgi:hypothetical protein